MNKEEKMSTAAGTKKIPDEGKCKRKKSSVHELEGKRLRKYSHFSKTVSREWRAEKDSAYVRQLEGALS